MFHYILVLLYLNLFLLKEYTWDYIKRNKRSSLGIMIAILMASILINMAGLYSYNAWKYRIHDIISLDGNWHGELFDETLGANLDYVKAYASVDEVMVKSYPRFRYHSV